MQQHGITHKFEHYKLEDGILKYKNKVYIPNSKNVNKSILKEMHDVLYAVHYGYKKTIEAYKNDYYWPRMKKEIAYYIARCLECQKVKFEHRHPTGLLQPLHIPKWKWDVVSMDFITKLPKTRSQHVVIMVVVDKLTKATHFMLGYYKPTPYLG